MIVKVQRPIHANYKNPNWLVYTRNRANSQLIPSSEIPLHVKTAMTSDYKAFFNAEINLAGKWIIGERVKNQNW